MAMISPDRATRGNGSDVEVEPFALVLSPEMVWLVVGCTVRLVCADAREWGGSWCVNVRKSGIPIWSVPAGCGKYLPRTYKCSLKQTTNDFVDELNMGNPPQYKHGTDGYIPSEHDKLRIRHLLDDEREKKKIDSLIDDDWLFIGEEVLPIYLRHRDARQAAHAYEDELNRLAALRHAEAVVREGPPTPQKETGTSNIATGSNVEDTTMGDAEDNSSIVESSGRNLPEEIPSDIGGELNDAEI
ncbi:hypothetical protein BD779DRAFT_1478311 [Infundibulicybe gibba]|nr:hypothetical protein BD779DRAFT_1478311 [Infundibulicybe gibba]